MQDVYLTVKKRAFPSHGRVRVNEAILSDLAITEGGHLELVNETAKKTVRVTVIADKMVPAGQIRVSAEDIAALGVSEESRVLVRRAPPLQEKLSKTAAEANKAIAAGARNVEKTAKKTAGEVEAEARKAAGSIKKATGKTAKDIKKTVRKVTGKGDDL